MRGPAAAAGLAFEADAEKSALDERLLADARTADSLPLLQFTLRRLYEQRADATGEAKLTHAAYDALGGLVGAIAAEAERAVAGLPVASLDALPRLLRRLAEPARCDDFDLAGSPAGRRGGRGGRSRAGGCAAQGTHPDRAHRCRRAANVRLAHDAVW